jgi:prepilin-type N-terminal cleavage/methylation domain-containing protein
MQKRNEAGFTLIELLIVIAVIGIIVTIGLSGYKEAQRANGQKQVVKQAEQVHQGRVDFVTKPARLEVFPGQHKAVTDSNEVLPGTYMVTFERAADAVGAESFPFTGFASSGDIRKGDVVLVYRVIYNQSIVDSERSPLLIMKKP